MKTKVNHFMRRSNLWQDSTRWFANLLSADCEYVLNLFIHFYISLIQLCGSLLSHTFLYSFSMLIPYMYRINHLSIVSHLIGEPACHSITFLNEIYHLFVLGLWFYWTAMRACKAQQVHNFSYISLYLLQVCLQ